MEALFGKHAADFGLTGNWKKTAAEAMERAIRALVNKATPIPGKYRGTPGTYWYDSATDLFVFVDQAMNVVAGWKLSAPRKASLLTKRRVNHYS
jgi:hypothetical protein